MTTQLMALTTRDLNEVIHLAERHSEAGSKERTRVYNDLHALVNALPDASKDELLALMWLGRAAAGETPVIWAQLLADARRESEPGKTESIVDKAPLVSYLRAGLSALNC